MKRFSWLIAVAALSIGVSAQRGGGPQGPQQAITPEPLKFRYMGPAAAGRIVTVAGVPGDPNTYYLGSASGGVWKSTDAGLNFVPIFDDQPVAAIGAIAVADRDPNIVWVGTGEPWVIRYSDVMGDGVYVSKDAGKTWKNVGLKETGRPLKDLDKAIWNVEVKLVSRSEIHSDDKYFPEAYKVYMNLIWLSGGVGQGASDEAGSIDYRPTDTQMQVLDVIEKELASAKVGYEQLMSTDLPAFNKAMAGKVPAIQ